MVDATPPINGAFASDAGSALVAGPAQPAGGITFRELLAGLNPLQHIPIIGTIYRAITGDAISETSRRIGSFAVSGLMGGPIGMLTNLALLAIEKLSGIDPEMVGQEMLASVGIGSHAAAAHDASGSLDVSPPPAGSPPAGIAAPSAWSASQLLAYGVSADGSGDLRRGDVRGSDVLNDLFLVRFAA